METTDLFDDRCVNAFKQTFECITSVFPQILLKLKLLKNYNYAAWCLPIRPNSMSENEDAVLISWQINEFYICMYGYLKGYQEHLDGPIKIYTHAQLN